VNPYRWHDNFVKAGIKEVSVPAADLPLEWKVGHGEWFHDRFLNAATSQTFPATSSNNSGDPCQSLLDVFNKLFIRIERVSLYMDVTSLTYGDGFPNAESFIKDPAGKKLVLGTHVRIGFPATHLWTKINA
jgi:hypothetical protein